MALPAAARQDLVQIAKVGFDFRGFVPIFSTQWIAQIQAFGDYLIANTYIGPRAPQNSPLTLIQVCFASFLIVAFTLMLQLKNIFDLTFKREFELTHGSLDAPNIPGEYCLENLHETMKLFYCLH